MSRYFCLIWVWSYGKIQPLHQIKSRQTPWIVYFPATLSFQGHITRSKSPSQQKFAWRTDTLRNGSIGCPCIGPKTWVQCQFFRASKRGFLVNRNLTDVHPNLNISRKKKKEKKAWYSGYEPRRTKILHNTPASYFFENLCLWLKSI